MKNTSTSSTYPNQAPIAHSNVPIFFLIVWVLFIIYGTLIPFEFDQSFKAGLDQAVWTPFFDRDGSRASVPDIIQNILLFMPVGFFALLMTKPTQRLHLLSLILIIGFCTGLSVAVEGLQLLSTQRFSSLTDVCTNTLGGFLGALSGWWCVLGFRYAIRWPWVRNSLGDTHFYLALFAASIAALYLLQPFDFSLDVGSVWSKVKSFMNNPVSLSTKLNDEWATIFVAMLFAHGVNRWHQRHKVVSSGLLIFLMVGFLISLEFAQFIVRSRMPTTQDALALCFGAVLGLTLLKNRMPSPVIIVFMFISLLFMGLHPFETLDFKAQPSAFHWLPFHAYYQRTNAIAFSNVIEAIIVPMPFVFAWVYNRRQHFALALIVVFCLSVGIEMAQQYSASRYADITDIICAVIGAGIGGWLARRCEFSPSDSADHKTTLALL